MVPKGPLKPVKCINATQKCNVADKKGGYKGRRARSLASSGLLLQRMDIDIKEGKPKS
jgi:hypothetical protein